MKSSLSLISPRNRFGVPFSRVACVCAGLAVGVLGANSARADVEIGQPAPEFALKDLAGRTVRLSDFAGRIVVLEWNNPDCPIVHKHYDSGNLPRMQHAAMAKGIVWLLINSGGPGRQGTEYSPDQIRAWLRKRDSSPTAYLLDPTGRVGHLYGARATPQVFVINAAGNLVYDGCVDSYRTADPADIPKAENYVREALTAVEKGQEVPKPRTRPFGCSVKYASAE